MNGDAFACWRTEEFGLPADQRAAKLPKLASSVTSMSKTPVKHMPDFNSVHAKSASKKISLAEHHANKLERAKMLTSQHSTIKTVRCPHVYYVKITECFVRNVDVSVSSHKKTIIL
jgi:hypothetical protein